MINHNIINQSQFRPMLRRNYQKIRQKLSKDFQDWSSQQVFLKVQKLPVYQKATKIALYQSIKGEIDLKLLWEEALKQNKQSFFPILNHEEKLDFLQANLEDHFEKNRYGILEPNQKKVSQISLGEINIIFMPLVCFDSSGTRLGMGKGYYDKTLETNSSSCLIGVAYDFQRYPFLEKASWDVALDIIVTPSQVYYCSSKIFN